MNRNVFPILTEEERRLPLYVTTVGGWDSQARISRPDGYVGYQWLQCLSGEGRLEVGGRLYAVGKGQGMFLLPNEPHAYYPVKEPWEIMWIGFAGSQARAITESLGFRRSQVLYVSNPDMVLKRIKTAYSLLDSRHPLRSFDGSAVLYDLLLTLHTSTTTAELRSKQQHYEQLAPVLDYIDDRYNQPLSLAELAAVLGLSTPYTCRLFQQTLGMRPFEYITRSRLRKAKELLLQEPELDVKQVASRVGYEHPSYFIKLFKQHEGVTPNMFRRIYSPLEAAAAPRHEEEQPR